ncbi:copper resistance protein CopC [Corynebacterium callunae]|uniref:copper resistance CopC family protein n=1 Tax=Corynebacterium callunae TaxID=1721 RepID=UPI0039823E96
MALVSDHDVNSGGFKKQVRALSALAGFSAFGALTFLAAPMANAHDVVISSNPENGSVVEEFPKTIELEFSGLPQDLFTTVALSNADTGEVLSSGTPTLQDQHIIYEVPADVEGAPGNYILGFQITSSDGHATKGSIEFEVAGAAATTTAAVTTTAESAAATTAESANTAAETTESSSAWKWVASIAAILVVAAAIVMMIAKNRNQK